MVIALEYGGRGLKTWQANLLFSNITEQYGDRNRTVAN